MELFHDRRQLDHLPTEDDYGRPLDRAGLAKANKRFRQFGVPKVVGTDQEKAARIVKAATSSRRKGQTFESVGAYLEFLNGLGDSSEY